jgi:mono/diheme cytochrome c family protein
MRSLSAALLALALPMALHAQKAKTGAEVYGTCAACHMANGAGMAGVFPPLAGSEWVTGKPEVPIAIVLHGMQGEVTVKGAKYNSVMTPWAAMFSDQEIANVVTYIRSQWGNKASAVTPAQVAAVRTATKARKTQWTEAELKKAYP